jgi:hypothetical protein
VQQEVRLETPRIDSQAESVRKMARVAGKNCVDVLRNELESSASLSDEEQKSRCEAFLQKPHIPPASVMVIKQIDEALPEERKFEDVYRNAETRFIYIFNEFNKQKRQKLEAKDSSPANIEKKYHDKLDNIATQLAETVADAVAVQSRRRQVRQLIQENNRISDIINAYGSDARNALSKLQEHQSGGDHQGLDTRWAYLVAGGPGSGKTSVTDYLVKQKKSDIIVLDPDWFKRILMPKPTDGAKKNAPSLDAAGHIGNPALGTATHQECSLIVDEAFDLWEQKAAAGSAPNLLLAVARPSKWAINKLRKSRTYSEIHAPTLPVEIATLRAYERAQKEPEVTRRSMPTVPLLEAHKDGFDLFLNAVKNRSNEEDYQPNLPLKIYSTVGPRKPELDLAAKYVPDTRKEKSELPSYNTHELRIYDPPAMMEHFRKRNINIFSENVTGEGDLWKESDTSLGENILDYVNEVPIRFYAKKDGKEIKLATLKRKVVVERKTGASHYQYFLNVVESNREALKASFSTEKKTYYPDFLESLAKAAHVRNVPLVFQPPLEGLRDVTKIENDSKALFAEGENAENYVRLLHSLYHTQRFYARHGIFAYDLRKPVGDPEIFEELRNRFDVQKDQKHSSVSKYLVFDAAKFKDEDACMKAIEAIIKKTKAINENWSASDLRIFGLQGIDVMSADNFGLYYRPYADAKLNSKPVNKYRTRAHFTYYVHFSPGKPEEMTPAQIKIFQETSGLAKPGNGTGILDETTLRKLNEEHKKETFSFTPKFAASMTDASLFNQTDSEAQSPIYVLGQLQMKWLEKNSTILNDIMHDINLARLTPESKEKKHKRLEKIIKVFAHPNGDPILQVAMMKDDEFSKEFRPIPMAENYYRPLLRGLIATGENAPEQWYIKGAPPDASPVLVAHFVGDNYVHLPMPSGRKSSRVEVVHGDNYLVMLAKSAEEMRGNMPHNVHKIYEQNKYPITWMSGEELRSKYEMRNKSQTVRLPPPSRSDDASGEFLPLRKPETLLSLSPPPLVTPVQQEKKPPPLP